MMVQDKPAAINIIRSLFSCVREARISGVLLALPPVHVLYLYGVCARMFVLCTYSCISGRERKREKERERERQREREKESTVRGIPRVAGTV